MQRKRRYTHVGDAVTPLHSIVVPPPSPPPLSLCLRALLMQLSYRADDDWVNRLLTVRMIVSLQVKVNKMADHQLTVASCIGTMM